MKKPKGNVKLENHWSTSSSKLEVLHLFRWSTHTQLCHTHTQLCHRQSFAQLLRHTQLLCHTQLCHIQLGTLCHTHNLSHTTLSHTALSHTHNFVRGNLSHTTLSHPHSLSRTSLSHTFVHTQSVTHTQLCHTHNLLHTNLSELCSHATFKIIDPPHLHCPFCFLRAASTTFSDYWKKLTCGVLRSFNCLCMLMLDLVFGYTCFLYYNGWFVTFKIWYINQLSLASYITNYIWLYR